MSTQTTQNTADNESTRATVETSAPDPEKWLGENSNRQVMRAVIRNLGSVEAVRLFVAYENQHDDRSGVLEMLQERAQEVR